MLDLARKCPITSDLYGKHVHVGDAVCVSGAALASPITMICMGERLFVGVGLRCSIGMIGHKGGVAG